MSVFSIKNLKRLLTWLTPQLQNSHLTSKIAHLLITIAFSACSPTFEPKRTFSVEAMKTDYGIMRGALEEAHPGLYRYTSRDSIKWIFDTIEKQLTRPMTEREFRKTVNPVFDYIRCGHTDIYQSTESAKFYAKKKNKAQTLPLNTVYLEHKLRIIQNNSADSTLKKGDEILAIDGQPVDSIMRDMRSVLSSDGYNQSFKNARINSSFSNLYWFLTGERDRYKIRFKDSTGRIDTVTIAPKKITKVTDTKPKSEAKRPTPPTPPKPVAKAPKENKKRTLKFSDRDSSIAILSIKTFSDGGYKRFYRKTFKTLKERNIKHLIIDLRANGGGRSDASINLMSYFIDTNYVAYDTVFAKVRKSSYEKHFGYFYRGVRFMARNLWSKRLPNGGMMNKSAGRWHKPNRKYRFAGPVYILTNGGSFSATSIFSSMVNEYCPQVTMIGRETGGGRYGCNAMISPYLVLPNTHARVRMPMFKIVLHIPGQDQGHGVMPEYAVEHSFDGFIKNKPDPDFEKAYELIKQK